LKSVQLIELGVKLLLDIHITSKEKIERAKTS